MKIFKLNKQNQNDKRILENLKKYLKEWNFEEDQDRETWLNSLPTVYGTIIQSKYEYDEQKVSTLLAYSKDRQTAEQTAAAVKQFFKNNEINAHIAGYLKNLQIKLRDTGIVDIELVDNTSLRSYTDDGYRGQGNKSDTWIVRLSGNQDYKVEIINFIYGDF